ncbi:MAG: CHASE3 domain-containing protein [Arthrospira sp. SH-MAG29]|nr:CHASE3 domain-containing protein [Arthrospira sp. SH-MAG29]MBS0017893.1 CHASE3 domain-containing protein [Arthrospira sp. SH-MAG29]
MKINQVIYLGFGAIFLLVGISSLGSEWQQKNQAQSFELVVRTYEIKLNLQDIQKTLVDAETAQRGFIITGDEDFLEPYYSAKRQIQSDLESLSKLLQVNPIQTQRLTNIQNLTNQKLASLEQGINLAGAGESEQVLALVGGVGKQVMDNIRIEINRMIDEEQKLFSDRNERYQVIQKWAAIINWGTFILVITSGSIISFIIVRVIMSPIQQVTQVIATSSAEIAVATEQQQRLAGHQAVSINQTTNAIEQISEGAKQSAEDADHALGGAQQVLDISENGNKVVEQNLASIVELNNNVANISEQIEVLRQHTGEISTVSNLVSSLANQTNILALNASVEAVRAGEAGRGFGLVAVEVRKLSDQSQKSARQIDNLVSLIQKSLKSTIEAAQKGTENAKVGIEMTENTAHVFVEVADGIKNVVSSNEKIAQISQQQAIAIQQVVTATNSINHAAVETASGIQQTQVGVQNLNQAAQTLRVLV